MFFINVAVLVIIGYIDQPFIFYCIAAYVSNLNFMMNFTLKNKSNATLAINKETYMVVVKVLLGAIVIIGAILKNSVISDVNDNNMLFILRIIGYVIALIFFIAEKAQNFTMFRVYI